MSLWGSRNCWSKGIWTSEGGYIRNLKFSALQLLNLINDILDLSAIEAGKIAFERTPFDLGYTVNRVFNALEQRAVDKGLTWSKSFSDDLPIH